MFNSNPEPKAPDTIMVSAEGAIAIVGYWLRTRNEIADRMSGRFHHGRYTESLELAQDWVDGGGRAELVKLWRLTDGSVVSSTKSLLPLVRMVSDGAALRATL